MADFDPSSFPATCTCGVLAGWPHAYGCATQRHAVVLSASTVERVSADVLATGVMAALCATHARRDHVHVGNDHASGPDFSAVFGARFPHMEGDDIMAGDEPTGDPERADAFWTITEDVRALCQSTRRRFWGELASLVEREWDCPPGYDRTAWAMEHASAGMVETAYRRVVG